MMEDAGWNHRIGSRTSETVKTVRQVLEDENPSYGENEKGFSELMKVIPSTGENHQLKIDRTKLLRLCRL